MKILLIAINSKYIHSNPAVYLIRAYACEHLKAEHLPAEQKTESDLCNLRETIEIAEYTINQQTEDILADIYRRRPDMLAFSCYIWNIRVIGDLLSNLPRVLPRVPVFLGGPEVSYDAPEVLRRFPHVTGVMVGEGEATFAEVARYYLTLWTKERLPDAAGSEADCLGVEDSLRDIRGLCLPGTSPQGAYYTGDREPLPMDEVPFYYREWEQDPQLGPFQNKILYYETSRGCPFRCSYCLSSIDKSLRLRSLELVCPELQFFLDHKVHQVKFIDRTFNCNEGHALTIWTYLAEHDNGTTNFHFEISADILTEAELAVLKTMRPGLVQLEIGVQSTNSKTIREIHRTMDLAKLRANVARVRSFRNIHQHLDLIAGLPYEGYERFQKSFNDLYEMQPDQLQLGFLKVLTGAYMAEQTAAYDLEYTAEPPYEVLSTRWITYAQIRRLKKIEEMVELYYNSLQFTATLTALVPQFASPFAFFDSLAAYYEEKGYFINQPARIYRYQVLLDFARAHTDLPEELLTELLTYDLYLRENAKSRPAFAKDMAEYRSGIYNKTEDRRNHIDVFFYRVWADTAEKIQKKEKNPVYLEFDYRHADPLSRNAKVRRLL